MLSFCLDVVLSTGIGKAEATDSNAAEFQQVIHATRKRTYITFVYQIMTLKHKTNIN